MASRRLPVRVRPVPPTAGIVQTVGPQSSKLKMRVRVPLSAPRSPNTRRSRDVGVTRNLRPLSRLSRALSRRSRGLRDTSRFSGEDRRLQHGARGFDPLSALQVTNGSRRVGHPGLSDTEPALRSIRR